MIQIVEKSFESIEKAREFANIILIDYQGVEDVSFLYSEKNGYTTILKFNIKCKYSGYATFDLARLNRKISDEIKYVWENEYKILFEDSRLKKAEGFKYMKNSIIDYGEEGYVYQLDLFFDFKDWIKVIEVKYNNLEGYEVILEKFKINSFYGYGHEIEKHFITKIIDKNILYDHIIEVYKQRGYLFDKKSLKSLEEMCRCIAMCMNKEKIREVLDKEK